MKIIKKTFLDQALTKYIKKGPEAIAQKRKEFIKNSALYAQVRFSKLTSPLVFIRAIYESRLSLDDVHNL